MLDNDDIDDVQERVFDCTDDKDEQCDDEGWYWFHTSGKIYNGNTKKKVNGKYYTFNDHGQILYEWINGKGVIQSIDKEDAKDLKTKLANQVTVKSFASTEDNWCSVPFISLYTDNVYSYVSVDANGTFVEGWK